MFMGLFNSGITVLFEKTTGVFIFCLLIIDTTAFLSAFIMVLLFRLLRQREKTHRIQSINHVRDEIERKIGGESCDEEKLLSELRELPDTDKASVFLEYSRLVKGTSRDWLIVAFRKAALHDWVIKSSVSRKWWRRLWAVRSVEILDTQEALETIRRGMRDKVAIIRLTAIQMVNLFPVQKLMEETLDVLKSERGTAKFIIKNTFVNMGETGSPLLIEFMREATDPELIKWGIEAAGDMKSLVFAEPLLEYLNHARGDIRAAAAKALSAFPEENIKNALVSALGDTDEEVRAMAAFSLGKIKDEETIIDIIRAFSDTSWMVRLNCALALRNMGAAGRRALLECMNHSDRYVADIARHVNSLPDYSAG